MPFPTGRSRGVDQSPAERAVFRCDGAHRIRQERRRSRSAVPRPRSPAPLHRDTAVRKKRPIGRVGLIKDIPGIGRLQSCLPRQEIRLRNLPEELDRRRLHRNRRRLDSTKAVPLNENGDILCKRTSSERNPIQDTIECSRTCAGRWRREREARGLGVPPRLREVLQDVLDADVALVETVARYRIRPETTMIRT